MTASPDPGETGTLRVADDCEIPLGELTWRFLPSGGPGGQHANRAATRVEVVFDVGASRALTDAQRARLTGALGERVSAVASEQRSQARNRALALTRLQERLSDALRERPSRRRTSPSRAGRERRLDAKRRRSEKKRLRRRVEPDEA